jgi:hypothetical protein
MAVMILYIERQMSLYLSSENKRFITIDHVNIADTSTENVIIILDADTDAPFSGRHLFLCGCAEAG